MRDDDYKRLPADAANAISAKDVVAQFAQVATSAVALAKALGFLRTASRAVKVECISETAVSVRFASAEEAGEFAMLIAALMPVAEQSGDVAADSRSAIPPEAAK